MKRIIGIVISVLLMLQLAFPVDAVSEDELTRSLHAKSALLMDGESGRVLYEKNGRVSMKNASTTKILTCMIALEQGKEEMVCTASEYAAAMPKVRLGVKPGQTFYLKDLLYSLMLESHNDSAVVIAESISGSVEKFAAAMNKKARKLGALHTNFVTPNGLDAEQHQTTAYDLALITRYALQNPRFIQIINSPSYSFTDCSGNGHYSVYNKNAFLNSYQGAYGVKTGFTGGAGYCFVGASRKGRHNLISVVLASGWPPNKSYKWQDTKWLMDYGRDNFIWKKFPVQSRQLPSVLVTRGKQETLALSADAYQALVRDADEIEIRMKLPEKVEAPVKKKQRIGTASLYINGSLEKKIPIRAAEEVDRITFPYVFRRILHRCMFDNR